MKTEIKERMIAKMLLMRKQMSTTSLMEFSAEEATRILGKEASYKDKLNKAIKIFKSILRYYSAHELKYSAFPPVRGDTKKEIIKTIMLRYRIYRNINFHLKVAEK